MQNCHTCFDWYWEMALCIVFMVIKLEAYSFAAVGEARDIMVHLTPLKPLLEGLESGEFQDAPPILPPLVHCICLLWAACPAYRKPDRIVTLFKEITNLLISMVSKCLYASTAWME